MTGLETAGMDLNMLLAIVSLITLFAVLFSYHKISQILSRQRQWAWEVSSNNYKQFEALLALYKDLDLPRSLPPMRGWAASPDFLRNLMQYTEDNCPTTIVECSSGVSTLVLARRVQLNGAGHVYSLEHDADFAQRTRLLLRRFGLEDFASVYHGPLQNVSLGDWDGSWYDASALPELPEIDLLVVDGPPFSTSALARYPAVPIFFNRLATGSAVFLDDAERPDERAIVQRWTKSFPPLEPEMWPTCEKGCVVLRRR